MKDYKPWWNLIHRHQAGHHSRTCKTWDDNYCGYICKYSWEPYGETAIELSLDTKSKKG